MVFYGDSITERRLYSSFSEAFFLTRFPKVNVRFVNSGWAGDTVAGGAGGSAQVRLQRDVIAYKPNVVTILLGMNDGHYQALNETTYNEDVYKRQGRIRACRAAGEHVGGGHGNVEQRSADGVVLQPAGRSDGKVSAGADAQADARLTLKVSQDSLGIEQGHNLVRIANQIPEHGAPAVSATQIWRLILAEFHGQNGPERSALWAVNVGQGTERFGRREIRIEPVGQRLRQRLPNRQGLLLR